MLFSDPIVNPPIQAWFRETRRLARLAGWSVLGSSLVGAISLSADLIERSPFLPSDFDPVGNEAGDRGPAGSNGPLSQRIEFRGYYKLNGEYRFLIREKGETSGYWVGMDDENAAFLIQDFDPVRKTVHLRQGDQEGLIELVQLASNSEPLPVSGQPPINPRANDAASAPGSPNATASTGGGNGSGRPVSGTSGSTSSANRRTPPPPPQWLQDRLAARGVDAAAAMREIAHGPPNFVPPPPPNFIPPPPPTDVIPSPDGNSSSNGNSPPDYNVGPPPDGTPGDPPDTPGNPPDAGVPTPPGAPPPPPDFIPTLPDFVPPPSPDGF